VLPAQASHRTAWSIGRLRAALVEQPEKGEVVPAQGGRVLAVALLHGCQSPDFRQLGLDANVMIACSVRGCTRRGCAGGRDLALSTLHGQSQLPNCVVVGQSGGDT
jgi:hypothetical protein